MSYFLLAEVLEGDTQFVVMEAGGSSESAAPSNSDQSNSSTKQNMAYRPQTNNRNGRNREPLIGSPPVRMPHQQPLIPGTPHISGHDDVSYACYSTAALFLISLLVITKYVAISIGMLQPAIGMLECFILYC